MVETWAHEAYPITRAKDMIIIDMNAVVMALGFTAVLIVVAIPSLYIVGKKRGWWL